MVIPYQQLSKEALNNLVEQFVLREGTDYGEVEKSLSEKVASVIEQIENGNALIVYSEEYQTVDIKPADSLSPAANRAS